MSRVVLAAAVVLGGLAVGWSGGQGTDGGQTVRRSGGQETEGGQAVRRSSGQDVPTAPAAPAALAALADSAPAVIIASKPFGESFLLMEIFAQLLESRGHSTDRRLTYNADDT